MYEKCELHARMQPWRFRLTCVVCERCVGACISCCVSGCRAVFHVSCASRQHYVMRTVLLARSDDVKLMAYCEKHSKWRRELHQLQERAAVSPRPTASSSTSDSSKRNSSYRRLKAVECRIDGAHSSFPPAYLLTCALRFASYKSVH